MRGLAAKYGLGPGPQFCNSDPTQTFIANIARTFLYSEPFFLGNVTVMIVGLTVTSSGHRLAALQFITPPQFRRKADF
jgi:hypothetical protein